MIKKLLIILALTLGTMGAFAAAPTADANWLSKAKADYPLKTCIVSGEELGGDMGDAVDYVYHQQGQPDRLIRFCCNKCVAKFEKNPQKYLKEIDEAAAKAKQH
jgi:hypothetical protein